METTSKQWLERYSKRLNDSAGDLSKLSSDERKHLRMLLQEHELEQRLVDLQGSLQQGELPLDETGDESAIS